MQHPLHFVLIFGLLGTACGSESRVLPPDPNPGADCASSADCIELSCIDDARFPGGYCSAFCTDAPCPNGARCIDGFGSRLCLVECTSTEDCRDGYQCWAGVCRPSCVADEECGTAGASCTDGRCTGAECASAADCSGGLTCLGGRCVEAAIDAGPAVRVVGEPCALPGECMSRICLPADLGGVCAAPCTDRTSCDSFDLACSPVAMDVNGDATGDVVATACVTANGSGLFLAGACATNADCESLACLDGQCQEACDDDTDCIAGQICTDVAYGALGSFRGCGYAPRGGDPDVVDIPLGSLGVNTSIPSSRVNLAIPNDAVSVTLMARRTGGDDIPLAFIDVWDPASENIFDYGDLVSWIDQPVRWIPINSEEHVSMLVPNSTPDRLVFRRGRYGFTAAGLGSEGGGSGTATVELTARVKRASGDVPSGTLDVNVFLVGVGLTESAARTNPRLQMALGELDTILGRAGVSVGAIEYLQITGTDATRFSVIDSSDGPTSEMAQLLRLSASRTNEAVNVFLVRGISEGAGESGGIALGVAGGIPGPPGVHGTMHSGVLVSFDPAVVGSDHRVVAQIMGHEVGHYLGLFHNRENAMPCAAGTGPTETNRCAPFGGEDVIEDTTRSDGDNLMWYALGGADGRTYNVRLSAGQGYVIRRSAVVR